MSVIEGQHQRSYAFRRWHIHIGVGSDERLDAVITTITRCIKQCGQSSDGAILRPGLGRKLIGPVA